MEVLTRANGRIFKTDSSRINLSADHTSLINTDVIIEQNVTVKARAVIGKGAILSEGCVIGEGSKVLSRVTVERGQVIPPYSIARKTGVFPMFTASGSKAYLKKPKPKTAGLDALTQFLDERGTVIVNGERVLKEHIPNRPKIGTGVIIGAHVLIGQGVSIGNRTHVSDGVVIGDGARIYAGCTIGEGAYISPHAKVSPNSSIPPYSVII